jgi:glycosyltransferase involved in cell wall biosynthesis
MRILRVAGDLYPAVVGGYGLHVHHMSRLQAKIGHSVTVYTSSAEGRPSEETIDGYHVMRFKPMLKLYGNKIQPGILLTLLAHRNEYDIVHAHSHMHFTTNVCAFARKFISVPLVITNHGLMSQTAPKWLNDIFLPTVGKWTFSAADMVICYTEEEKAIIVGLGIDPAKVRVIHNGIDTSLFHPDAKKKRTGRILWVGRYVPGKCVDDLVEAFALVSRTYPHLLLQMVGEGPLKGLIKEKVHRLGLDDRVEMCEFVPNAKLPALYRSSDMFVLPSMTEGVPRTLLEAMACGVPVVCTNLPQLAPILEGCGLQVPVNNAKELAAAITRLVDDVQMADTLGEAGRAKVHRDYSWEDTVQKTIMLYREILGSPGPVPESQPVEQEGDLEDKHRHSDPQRGAI